MLSYLSMLQFLQKLFGGQDWADEGIGNVE